MSEGLVVVVSSRPFEDTLNALVASVKHRQVEVFGMVDHAVNAQGAGLTLGRTTVVTFGGAKAGTPLMQAHQTLGLDLPLRALVYETAEGQVRIAYREPRDILAGQGVAPDAFPSVDGMSAWWVIERGIGRQLRSRAAAAVGRRGAENRDASAAIDDFGRAAVVAAARNVIADARQVGICADRAR